MSEITTSVPLFIGATPYTMDPKGRVTMPKRFREAMDCSFVAVLWHDECISCLPLPMWERLRRDLPNEACRFLLNNSHFIRAHRRHGRWPVPVLWRQSLGVAPGDDVMAVGCGDVVEYWAAVTYHARRERTRGALMAGRTFPPARVASLLALAAKGTAE